MKNKFLGRFSLLQQWVALTFIAILPLLIAVSFAVTIIERQNNNKQKLVKNMEIVSRAGSEIEDLVKEMVRLSRQYVLLNDKSFVDLYRQKSTMLKSDIETLRPYLTSQKQQKSMNLMVNTADKISNFLNSDKTAGSNVNSSLHLLIGLSEELSFQVDNYRYQSLQNSEMEFKNLVRQLFAIILPALLGTLLLMMVGISLISKPVLKLSEAIKSLANQHWESPISIAGPSDLAALGENLEWMRKQILASDKQKAAFVQHITHELKTPLAAIIEAGNLFYEEISGPLTDRQRSILNVLRANANILEHLIQQLLNYNAVSHGIVTQRESIDIRQLIQSIFNRIKASDPEKSVQIEVEGDQDMIYTDPRLLEMILKNLLGNAFQFVPDEGVITVQWEQGDSEWHLQVTDNGPGIDPTFIDNIFMPFFSGQSNKSRKVPKTGIGLAVVKESVNLMKGSIEVISDVGQGASFSMTFPIMKPKRGS